MMGYDILVMSVILKVAKADNLRLYKESKHEGMLYTCDECAYAATQPSNLKRHKKRKHY